jgi:uncharacterized protein (TIRG00374 family)
VINAILLNLMNSKLFSFLKYTVLLALALGLLAFAFRGVNVSKIIHQMLQANMFWIAVSVIPSIVALISRAYRWNLLIESSGFSAPLHKTTYSLMVGYFANLAFPRLGEVTRCGALSRSESIPFNVLLGTVIVERVVDVVSLLLCLLLACILEFKRLGDFLLDNIVDPIVNKFNLLNSPLILAGLVGFILAVVLTARYLNIKKKRLGKESKAAGFVKGLINGVKSLANLKRPWLFVFHSAIIWFLYYLSMYISFFAFPFTSSLGWTAALFLLVAGGFGMSAPVQGGIGVYHLLVSQGLMLYGLTKQQGLTFATLIHSSQMLLITLLGLVSLIFLFSERKRHGKDDLHTAG